MARNDKTYTPGRKRTGGRPPGTPNKTTVAVKEAIMNAFELVGGQQYLVMVALKDPKTFCTLLGRVLPAELNAKLQAEVVHEFSNLTETERSSRITAILDAARGRATRPTTH